MNIQEIGQKLVDYSNADRADLAVSELYADDIVSVEADAATTTGIAGIKEKHHWWDANHQVHSAVAEGPYVGAADQFIVKFAIDVTPRDGERIQMEEVGLYTVANGRVVREEFMPTTS